MIENQKSQKPTVPHNLIMENRNKLSISGVIKVDNFDEQSIILVTEMGEMTIKGSDLHISKMDVDTGDMKITGSIYGLVYNDNASNGSFISRIFK